MVCFEVLKREAGMGLWKDAERTQKTLRKGLKKKRNILGFRKRKKFSVIGAYPFFSGDSREPLDRSERNRCVLWKAH